MKRMLALAFIASSASAQQSVTFLRELPPSLTCTQKGDMNLVEDNNLTLRKKTVRDWTKEAASRGANTVLYTHRHSGTATACAGEVCAPRQSYIIEVRFLACT